MCIHTYIHTVTDCLKALLGSGSLNTFKHATVRAMFSMWSAPCSSIGAVFSAWSVPHLYNESMFGAKISTELSTMDTEVRIAELSRKCFICAVG
jgi:hypothetical protein